MVSNIRLYFIYLCIASKITFHVNHRKASWKNQIHSVYCDSLYYSNNFILAIRNILLSNTKQVKLFDRESF